MATHYEDLMTNMNERRKELFGQMIRKEITPAEFNRACREMDKELETNYLDFIAKNRIFMSAQEIETDMGFPTNYS